MIYVCGLDEMPEYVRALRPGYLVSLVQSTFQPPTPAEIRPDRHLRLAVDDVSEPVQGYVTPGEEDVQKLIDFLRSWPGDEALLLHCYAGVSRSTAAALIALALNADGREMEAARVLRDAAPHAQPNSRIVALADRLLGREGRLVAAREAMGPAVPMFEGPLVELSPLR
jgi:predicted protein tyrosine phosphatase